MNSNANKKRLGLLVQLHNDREFVDLCLSSACAEWSHATQDIHVLVTGSTDGTDTFVREWGASFPKENRPRIEVVDANLGPLQGLKTLVAFATTPWVSILHGDDFLLPGFFRSSSQIVENLDDNTVAIRDFQEFQQLSDGKTLAGEVARRKLVWKFQPWNRFVFSVYNVAAPGGSLMSLNYLREILVPLPDRLLCAEDWLLFSKVLDNHGRLVRVADAKYGYRRHTRNTTFSPLQEYSVGFVRAVLCGRSNRFLSWVSCQQVGREKFTFGGGDLYQRGFEDGSAFAARKITVSRGDGSSNRWASLPFLVALKVASVLTPS